MLNPLYKWSINLNDDEIKIISKMENDFFGINSYTYEELIFFKNNKNYQLVCLSHENKIIGYAILFITDDQVEIYKIAINDKFRNKGYGTYLLNGIKNKFSNSKLFIEVSENNNAYHFYLKNGFINYGLRKNYYSDGSNAHLMVFNPNT